MTTLKDFTKAKSLRENLILEDKWHQERGLPYSNRPLNPEPYMRHIEQLEGRIKNYNDLFVWLLGEQGEFPDEPEPLAGKYRQRFWWRKELRQRLAALAVTGEEGTSHGHGPE